MTNLPFNGPLYIQKQTQAILDRLEQSSWLLYLEVGGHFLVDGHASRVLPGYIPDSKTQIFKNLAQHSDLSVIFCINAKDVVRDRQFSQKYLSFEKYLFNELESIRKNLPSLTGWILGQAEGLGVRVCITMLDRDFIPPHVRELEAKLHEKWYDTYHKYMIDGYPNNTDLILSNNGYGKDDYIPSGTGGKVGITLVSACGSNSGKFWTCLSQLYLDHTIWTNSSYAKFETFPIRNRDLHHPTNLAYEAATADIGDYNIIDPYYLHSWKEGSGEIVTQSINYNRDVEAFEILKNFQETLGIVIAHSPTEMWINTAGFCINNDKDTQNKLSDAARVEIQSRIETFTKLLNSGHGEEEAVTRCQKLLKIF